MVESLSDEYNYVRDTAPPSPQTGETWLDTSSDPPVEQVYVGGQFVRVEVANAVISNLDAAISTRSSHGDPDPNNRIDAAISSRSSHTDPDPNGFIDAAISSAGATQSDIESGVDNSATGTTVADRLDAAISTRSSHGDPDPNNRIDAAISSRSSHTDPDPNGFIDAAISSRSSHADPDPDGYIDAAISSRSDHPDPDPNGYIDAPVSSAGGGIDWSTKTAYFNDKFSGSGSNVFSVSGSGAVGYLRVQQTGTNDRHYEVTVDGSVVVSEQLFTNDVILFRDTPCSFDQSFAVNVTDFDSQGFEFEVNYALD